MAKGDDRKPWGGRFSRPTDRLMERFSASEHFDRRLAAWDIAGSSAHARMLASVGVLSAEECRLIVDGLQTIAGEIADGRFNWRRELEDVHMNIESRLTELVGDAGKKLHTARSRNDQVATDMRLFVRDALDGIIARLRALQSVLLDLAEREADAIMPGLTHMQSAQPVTLGHHLMAWFEMLDRDAGRFADCRARLNFSPLGAAALAGTSFPVDRRMTADELGFDGVTANSLDSVSDRDFVMEFGAAAAILAVHLSRFSEELVLWSSERFGFVDLGDDFCTGSSIMPQKKNPDAAELVRGKTGRVAGNLVALLTLMKGQPLAYNRDNQEDKEPVFDTVDTVNDCLDVYIAMLPGARFDRARMRAAAADGHPTATDLADYLVRRGVPFRDAHEVVGKVVAAAIADGVALDAMPIERLRSFSDAIGDDVTQILSVEGSVNARDHVGGTAPARVRQAVADGRRRIAAASPDGPA